MSENYTAQAAKNSAWTSMSFIISTACNVTASIIITRYLGKDQYGAYSYFIWLSSVFAIIAGFGLNQTITKYIPKYFFDAAQKTKAITLLQKLLKIQLIITVFTTIVFLLISPLFQNAVQTSEHFKKMIFFSTALAILPLTFNTFLSNSLGAIQKFKSLSVIQIIIGILNVTNIIFLVILKAPLEFFLFLFIGTQAVQMTLFKHELKKILSKKFAAEIPKQEIKSYTLLSYLNNLFGQIAWDRSEILFLGIFSSTAEIGIYSLTYSLAVLSINAFGPINTVLTNLTAQMVGAANQEKLSDICAHATKYLAMIMLPTMIFGTLFAEEIIKILYGQNFAEVGLLFPFLVIPHTIAVIITPASNIAFFRNEIKRMTVITLITGILNIILDIALIPKYSIWGAIAANTTAQLFSITATLINARKYKLGLLNKFLAKVVLINLFITAGMIILIQILPSSLLTKIVVAGTGFIVYILAILKLGFNQRDLNILENLKTILPKKVLPLFDIFFRNIQKNVSKSN